MGDSIRETSAVRHLLSPEKHRPRMAKAHLRKAENPETWRVIGLAVERMRQLMGLLLKEVAVLIERDERQVARWIAGTERPQVDAIFAVVRCRGPFVIALAEQAQDVEVVTEIRVRRRAS